MHYFFKLLQHPFTVNLCLIILFNLFYGDFEYCTDNEQTLQSLKEELHYWQNDLEGLTHLYKSNGYDTLNHNQLTEQQLTEKTILEESIKDGRKNVKTSIEAIKHLKDNNYQAYNQSQSSSLGKRLNENTQTQGNKRQS